MRLLVQAISIDIIMLQLRVLLFIIIVVLPNKPVIAFPHLPLRPRQGLDIWDSISHVDWGKVTGSILTGIGGLGTVFENTDQPQEEEDKTTTTTPDQGMLPGPASPGPLTSNAAQELDLGQPSGEFIRPPTEDSVPSVPPPCDAKIFSRDCGKVLDQVIFTTGCSTMSPDQLPTATAIAQNAAILDEVKRVATEPVLTTTSDHCDLFMIVASLPAEESERIKLLPGVLGVSSDTYFISGFLYDSTGGADTEVFYMGPGVAMNHPDFANNPITRDDFIFANGLHPDDTLDEDSEGTCAASLIRGNRYGVSKHTRLSPVRSSTKLSSLMNAMVQILRYIRGRPQSTGNGFVMLFTMLWLYENQVDKARFETLLGMLVFNYGVVIVMPGEQGVYPGDYAKDSSSDFRWSCQSEGSKVFVGCGA
ncbi:hypothetical protein MMC22_001463 [Lobaria immixta]|nr:hypothetical protein [Lobaria immixta]